MYAGQRQKSHGQLRTWTWSLGLASGSLAVIVNGLRPLYDFFVKDDPKDGIVLAILALFFGSIILYYLFSDPVQRSFGL
jgi:hypothetical protein